MNLHVCSLVGQKKLLFKLKIQFMLENAIHVYEKKTNYSTGILPVFSFIQNTAFHRLRFPLWSASLITAMERPHSFITKLPSDSFFLS